MISYREISDMTRASVYLRRWTIDLPFGWTLKLHKIVRPDDDRCQHSHPWIWVRLVLIGGYVEMVKDRERVIKPWRPWAFWRIGFCGPSYRHRIVRFLNGTHSWSLIICGPHRGKWGFFTRSGYVPWEQFVNETREHRVAWCDDGSKVELK